MCIFWRICVSIIEKIPNASQTRFQRARDMVGQSLWGFGQSHLLKTPQFPHPSLVFLSDLLFCSLGSPVVDGKIRMLLVPGVRSRCWGGGAAPQQIHFILLVPEEPFFIH